MAIVSLATGWTLTLGIDPKSTVLLILPLLVATLSLDTGRTTVLQGMVHLVIFAVYLFTTFAPSASGSLNPDESGLPDAEGKQKLRRDRRT